MGALGLKQSQLSVSRQIHTMQSLPHSDMVSSFSPKPCGSLFLSTMSWAVLLLLSFEQKGCGN